MNNSEEISLTPEYSSALNNYEMLCESLLEAEEEKKNRSEFKNYFSNYFYKFELG